MAPRLSMVFTGYPLYEWIANDPTCLLNAAFEPDSAVVAITLPIKDLSVHGHLKGL